MEVTVEVKTKDEIFRPDAIIVIGAGLLKDGVNIIPSAQTQKNVERLIQLLIDYNNLWNDQIPVVFSGGYTADTKDEATIMEEYFFQNFKMFSERAVWLEFQSKNSYENIYYCLNLIEKEGWQHVIVIDQPMHLPQLKLLTAKELRRRRRKLKIFFVGAESVWGNNIQSQWSSPFRFFLYEILSTSYYLLKGKIL